MEFVAKWAGALLLGPFIPAIFAAFTIATGQYLLNTWEAVRGEKCGYPIDVFVSLAIVVCYFLLLIYSWVWLGFNYRIKVPYTKTYYTITSQFSSMYWVAYVYIALAFFSF